MAKRKKRVTVRKRKPTVRGRARSSSRTVRGKAAKRTTIKLRPKKGMAKAQRHTAKRKNARPIKPSVIPVAQTTIVDIAEEPGPAVTEFEETDIREADAGRAPPEES
jgi:hypothetical protein